MRSQQIQISVVDTQWPVLKCIVNVNGHTIREESRQYDIALSQFTPLVQDALRIAVDDVIKSHKR
jgi:hypothetical protein